MYPCATGYPCCIANVHVNEINPGTGRRHRLPHGSLSCPAFALANYSRTERPHNQPSPHLLVIASCRVYTDSGGRDFFVSPSEKKRDFGNRCSRNYRHMLRVIFVSPAGVFELWIGTHPILIRPPRTVWSLLVG